MMMKNNIFVFGLFLLASFLSLLTDIFDCDVGLALHAVLPWAAIAGGVAATGGALSSVYAQQKANDANIQIARETNRANYEMLRSQQNYEHNQWLQQNAWNLQQWNRENEYNSPANQAKLWKDAGFNPLFTMGNYNAGAGDVSSIGQNSVSANPMVGAHVDPADPTQAFSALINGAMNSINALANQRFMKSQTEKAEAETKQINEYTPAQLQYIQKLASKEGALGDIARTDLAYYQAIQGQRISEKFNDVRLQQTAMQMQNEQISNYRLQNKLLEVEQEYAPQLKRAELSRVNQAIQEMKANISLTLARRDLTLEQKLTQIEETYDRRLGNSMKEIDKNLYEDFKRVSLQTAKESLYDLEDNRFFKPLDKYHTYIGKAANYVILPGSASAVGKAMERNNRRDRWSDSDRYGYFRPRYNH